MNTDTQQQLNLNTKNDGCKHAFSLSLSPTHTLPFFHSNTTVYENISPPHHLHPYMYILHPLNIYIHTRTQARMHALCLLPLYFLQLASHINEGRKKSIWQDRLSRRYWIAEAIRGVAAPELATGGSKNSRQDARTMISLGNSNPRSPRECF